MLMQCDLPTMISISPSQHQLEGSSQSHAGVGDTTRPFLESVLDRAERGNLHDNLHDVERLLSKTPITRKNNAFHDTLNSKC